MLTQRYALYIIALGLAMILAALGIAINAGFSLLIVLLGFYGLLSTLAGLWMWDRGRSSV